MPVEGQKLPTVGMVPEAVTLVTMAPASREMVAMAGEVALVVIVQVNPTFLGISRR
jgi:hypothetical protein